MSTSPTATSTTSTVADHIIERLREGDYRGLVERAAPDVLLDMNLPTWRFQRLGRDDVRQYFSEQFAHLPAVRCTQSRVHSTANPVVVETECRFDGEGREYLWRAVDVVETDGDHITRITQYCSGCWDPDTIARNAAEAPMIRW
jgi:ketosteroid isomerase-like protein